MAIAYVQGNAAFGAGAATLAVTLGADLIVNNLAVVGSGRANTAQTLTSVTDDGSGGSNTYTAALGPIDSGAARLYQSYTVNAKTLANVITQTWSGGTSNNAIAVDEYSGCATASVAGLTSSGAGTSLTPAVTGFDPTDGSLVAASVYVAANRTLAAGANFTAGSAVSNTASIFALYRLSSSGTETAPGTISGAGTPTWAEIAVEYKAAGGAATVQADATLAEAFALSGDVTMETSAAATLAEAFDLTANVTMETSAAATLAGAFDLSADVTVTSPAVVEVDATLDMSFGLSASVEIAGQNAVAEPAKNTGVSALDFLRNPFRVHRPGRDVLVVDGPSEVEAQVPEVFFPLLQPGRARAAIATLSLEVGAPLVIVPAGRAIVRVPVLLAARTLREERLDSEVEAMLAALLFEPMPTPIRQARRAPALIGGRQDAA